jgi:hypothetical protein
MQFRHRNHLRHNHPKFTFQPPTTMKKLISNLLPAENPHLKWTAVGLTVAVAGLLTLWGIYGIEQYGIALFVLTPLLLGAGSTILYGLKKAINWNQAWQIGFLSLGIYTAGLLIFAIEGLICIAMAAPIGLILTLLGSFIGYSVVRKIPDNATTTLLILIGYHSDYGLCGARPCADFDFGDDFDRN